MVGTGDIDEIFRSESGKAIASLVRRFGDVDIAEEAVQEAFLQAVRRWPIDGVPASPAGWIIVTARNRAIDWIRREASRAGRHRDAVARSADDSPGAEGPVEDDRLGLIFMCCHPSLDQRVQVALTLKLVCGLRTEEIAAAFLVPDATMAQRLVRAKRKIKSANIRFKIPEDHDLTARLSAVLAVIYLMYGEGHLASSAESLTRDDLADEGLRLARMLADLMPDEPEVKGLVALFLLTEARRPARLGQDGRLVLLAAQNRDLWNREAIQEGHHLIRECLQRNEPGPYQIQAAIAAVHADAATAADTDWAQIVALYDQLRVVAPGPIVEMNRAVAVAQLFGPAAGLTILDGLDLTGHHRYHVARAELLSRLGCRRDATSAFDKALALAVNPVERTHLEERRRAVGGLREDASLDRQR